jgi:hypothetical protein
MKDMSRIRCWKKIQGKHWFDDWIWRHENGDEVWISLESGLPNQSYKVEIEKLNKTITKVFDNHKKAKAFAISHMKKTRCK